MRVLLDTLGCRLNEAEIERWAAAFVAAGDALVDAGRASDVDVIVLNSCAVTREAVAKSRRRLARLARAHPRAKLVLSGCWSALESPLALADLGVDLVVANADKEGLVERVREAFAEPAMPASASAPDAVALFGRNRHRAFVKVQDGCRWRCTYCVVTLARGAERSRPVAELVAEVRALVASGLREIVLTGVHVGGYGGDEGSDLATLVRALLADTDVERLRFASVEPWDLSPDFVRLFDAPRVQPHLHLPLQSGSDTVLRRMARRCRTTDFSRLVAALRERAPTMSITTDVICGFPGESEREWQETLDFVAAQDFAHVHAFTFSEREGTKAATLPDPVPPARRRARTRELAALAARSRARCLERALGARADVLFEGGRRIGANADGTPLWGNAGYTPNYLRVQVHGAADLANRILPTRLVASDGERLRGEIASAAPELPPPRVEPIGRAAADAPPGNGPTPVAIRWHGRRAP